MSQRERSANAPSKPDHEAPASVLIIDDDEHFRRFLASFLRGNGYAVTSANSGREGILSALELTPDLVLCDLDMPGMNGYEVLARLRQDTRLADIPVMFLTGQSAPESIREGMSLGADDYLTKPVDSRDLLRAVKARLDRVRISRQQREKQMERAMQMFAEVVHDLRDPLFVVFGYTKMLRDGGPEKAGSEERAGEILDRMQRAIGRMQTIVSETLFLAKHKMRQLPFDPCPFDLRVLCEQVITDLDQGDRLRFECAEQECDMVGDPLRLRQALENLLANALKYSAERVVMGLLRRPNGWLLEVKDRGIGIPESERPKIFDPFFRASNTGDKPGHGLGLSIVKTCVEQHGGQVGFVTATGKGTTFVMELPLTPPVAIANLAGEIEDLSERSHKGKPPGSNIGSAGNTLAKTQSPPAESVEGGNSSGSAGKPLELSCIIVDDDPLVRDLLRDLLTRSGDLSVVGEAGSVAQAQQLVTQHSPAVVFLDINLPDAPGFELLSHLEPATSVVFVTSAEEYAISAFDADAVDYLLKPVSAERLQKAMKRVRQRIAVTAAVPSDARLKLDDTFLVKTMSEKKLVKVRDLKSVIAYGEYSWVYWDKGKGALLRKPLKQWETELPDNQFVRIHRHAIINLAFMERVEKLSSGQLKVHMRDTTEPISVSLRLAPAFNRKLKSFGS